MGLASQTQTDMDTGIETQIHIATDPSWGHMNPTHRPTQSMTETDMNTAYGHIRDRHGQVQ